MVRKFRSGYTRQDDTPAIGDVTDTGNSTGPSIHFEFSRGFHYLYADQIRDSVGEEHDDEGDADD